MILSGLNPKEFTNGGKFNGKDGQTVKAIRIFIYSNSLKQPPALPGLTDLGNWKE
jgi:hypothetical protein